MTKLDMLQQRLTSFMHSFEWVFDGEWEVFTEAVIRDTDHIYIAEGGTFLNPGVEDESNNWANRGSLLGHYRRLKAIMEELDMTEDTETEG
jgi:hypothetical protein